MLDSLNEAPKTSDDDEISLIDLLATLLKHKRMILLVTLAAVLVSLAYAGISLLLPPNTTYLPNLYKPTATMLVNSPDSGGGLSSALASSGLSGLAGMAGISTGGTNYGQLAVVIAKGDTILDTLVDKFDLIEKYKIHHYPKTESRKALLKHYAVTLDAKTALLTISFEDPDPEFGRNLVNYAVDLLDKRFATIGQNRNIAKHDQLESKLTDVQAQMTVLEDDIQKFQQKYGVISVDTIAKEQISTEAQVRSELIMKEMEIKTYGDVSKVQDPALMRLEAERDNLSKLLDQLEKGFTTYEKVLPSQRELPSLAIEFSHMQRDLLIQQKIFEILTQQNELTKLQIEGADPIIQVLEPAEAPDMKSGPSRAKIVMVATFAAFFLAILLAFVLEAWSNLKADPVAMAKLKGTSR
jgi:uncharacterized protein involved in exopolysaccharide biosynthesis